MPDEDKRSAWSILATVLTAMTPVLLLVGGYKLNEGISIANLEISRQRVAIDTLKADAEAIRIQADTHSVDTKTQVEKVNVIRLVLEDLTGTNTKRKLLAVQIVQLVLPEKEAINVLSALQDDATDKKVGGIAKSLLDAQRDDILVRMFSDRQYERKDALRRMRQAWYNDDKLIGMLIDRANIDLEARQQDKFPKPAQAPSSPDPNAQRLASISNTAAFLVTAQTKDDDLKKRILQFAVAAEKNSEVTAMHTRAIKERFE